MLVNCCVNHQELQLGIQSLTSVTHYWYEIRSRCFEISRSKNRGTHLNVQTVDPCTCEAVPRDRYCSNLRDRDLGEWVCSAEIGKMLGLYPEYPDSLHTMLTLSRLLLASDWSDVWLAKCVLGVGDSLSNETVRDTEYWTGEMRQTGTFWQRAEEGP